MVYVKCKFCGKRIKKDDAYVVPSKKRNKYYCSYEHSISKTDKDLFYETLWQIFGKTLTNTAVFKEFGEIAKVHGYSKMLDYAIKNMDKLQYYGSHDDKGDTTYGKIRYIAAVFKNNLDDYHVEEDIVREDMEYLPDIKFKKNKERLGLEDVLERILDG